MKKSTLRSSIWFILIVLSLSSYLYLSTVEVPSCESYSIEEEKTMEEDQVETKVILPDIALAKKVIKLSKLILGKTIEL